MNVVYKRGHKIYINISMSLAEQHSVVFIGSISKATVRQFHCIEISEKCIQKIESKKEVPLF